MKNNQFENQINYSFKNKELLDTALTHSSFSRENSKKENNERLEFLGDAFLDAIIGVELYQKMDRDDEGRLTKTRALIVCEKSLAVVARKLDMGNYLNMGKGEAQTGGRMRESILADAVEAVIGAIYLDGGYDQACRFVHREFEAIIRDALKGNLTADYKTAVQEVLQKGGKHVIISYEIDREEGPDHDKTFYVHLVCNGKSLGRGIGKNKKEAEQNAAKATLETMKKGK